ncbi:MAG: hypothetical protein RR034_07930 [Bacteroidales bacterium]
MTFKINKPTTYKNFRDFFIGKHENSCALFVEELFEAAVEFTKNGDLETATQIADDCMVFIRYSDVGYKLIYYFGFFCQLLIDKEDFKGAEDMFKRGLKLIEIGTVLGMNAESFKEDVDSFYQLKDKIDNLKKSKYDE